MKNVIYALSLAAIALTMVACNNPNKENTITGVIIDATMINVVIVNGCDTMTFSTMDADKSEVNGILIGDTATVTYNGDIKKNNNFANATKLVVNPIQDPLVGSWVKPIEGIGGFEGIEIVRNGVATSINSATLLYETWRRDGNLVILTGKSIGNGQTIDFSDSLVIQKLDADSLVLAGNQYFLRFAKQ